MGDIALKVEGLTKEYRLGTIGYGTMREDLQTWWARVRGKEDPNSLITASHHSESEKKHFLALDDINFEIKKGDRVGIIGRNGAGKSTLLKILSRITSPTKGNIYIDGRIGSLLEVGTGFHQELTGRENIYLNGSILGMKKKEIDRKLDEIIDFAGIERFIDTPVKRYSSGMFVRLGFAVAAHLEPEILIVDEVLAVGDADFQKKAVGKMEDVSINHGKTVLFVSHNMQTVMNLCQKSILLNKGTIEKIGKTRDIVSDYLYTKDENNDVSLIDYDKINRDPIFDLQSINILQDNNEVKDTIDNGRSLDLVVAYTLHEDIKGFRLYFDVCDEYDLLLFRSFNDEDNVDHIPVKKGQYLSKLRIPANTFGPINYILKIQGTIYNDRNLFSIKKKVGVENTGLHNRAYPDDSFRSKLALYYKWDNIENTRF